VSPRLALLFVLAIVSAVQAQAPDVPSTAADVTARNAESKRLSEIEPEPAMRLARQALEGARALRLPAEEGEALHNIAVAYRALGDFELASETARESADAFRLANNPRGEAQAYNTLGLIALDRAEYDRALEYQLRALDIRERTSDREGLGYSYNNLGNIYRASGNYAKALEYHRRGLAIKIELGNRPSEAFSHHNIGHVYRAMGDIPQALASYRKGLAIREALGDQFGVASSLNAIGQLEEAADPRAALGVYQRALAIRQAMNDWRGEAETHNNISRVHLKLGDPASARTALTQALAITERREAPLTRADTFLRLSETYEAMGDPRAALKYYRDFVTLHDKTLTQENAERLTRLQAAHESDRREQQIKQLQLEGELSSARLAREQLVRRGLIASLIAVVVGMMALYGRFRYKQQSEARLRAQATELADALEKARTLRGLLPICASCKKIRDDNGYWTQVEAYVRAHSQAEFTHSLCPECTDELYPGLLTPEERAALR